MVLEGRTIGSSQDSGAGASTSAGGDVFNTAAGGGRVVDTDGDGKADKNIPGRANYFVIENFDPADENRQGGQERPVGNPDEGTDFAIMRLATGTESTELAPGEGGSFSGVSAGMLEQETETDQVNVRPVTSSFDMTLSPETNRMVVNGEALTFGGLEGQDSKGESVYIDDNRFAARTDGEDSDVAFVSGQVLQQAAAALPEDNATREFLDVPEYKHLKWGFFFGDVATANEEEGRNREHVHLGSWVAGDVITDPSRLPSNGTATYSGHAFGNVLNGQDLYAARGSYQNQWNFGSRAGIVTMDFDGSNVTGFARMADGSVVFTGSLAGDGRTAGINGVFVRGDEAAGQAPGGQIGTFQMRGENYNAIGTFGGQRE